MVGAVSLALLLFAAPDAEASKALLRIAYASQYEWREDKVANATLDFAWEESGEDAKMEKWTHKAQGTCVLVDGELKRVHLPAAGRVYRDRVRLDLEWVMRRFVRQPFDEAFKDATFQPPEEMADGNTRIGVNGLRFLVANNRITGMELNLATPEKPSYVRVVFEAADLGGGYGILGENLSHSFGGSKTESEHQLTVRMEGRVPVPESLVVTERGRQGATARRIRFSNPRLNLEHPIAVDAAARDSVKAAWERRYAWPEGVRVEGGWTRELDNATVKGRWTRDVSGDFQLLGGILELTLDEGVRVNPQDRPGIVKSCQDDLRACFDLLAHRPFDKAFPDCGFEPDAEAGEGVIRVLGHPEIMAVRVEDGALVGHRTDEFGATEWWEYKLKKLPDGRMRLDRMTRLIGQKKRTIKYAYSTKKGVYALRSADRVVPVNQWGSGEPDDVGIITYEFKKIFVQVKE